MRILIIGINFYPELTGIGKYTGEMAVFLRSQGDDIHMITAPPYYPYWRVSQGYKAWRYKKESWNGIAIYRCPLWVPRNPSGFTRIIHLLSFALSSIPILIMQVRWKADIVMCIAPTLFSAPFALMIARLSHAKSWLHIQDFELEAALKLGMIKNDHFFTRVAMFVERWLLQRFDRVSTISKQMHLRLTQKGVPSQKAVLFPNWVDTNLIFPLGNQRNSLRDSLGIPDDGVVILYSGNMGFKQGLESVIAAAELLEAHENLLFLLCGEGAARSGLEKSAQDLKNVKFLDLQPIETLNILLNAADIHLLPQQAGAADLVMPSKLLGILASGKPVIATANAGTELEAICSQVGVVVMPQDLPGLCKAILQLAEQPALRQELGIKGRDYVCKAWGQDTVLTNINEQFLKLRNLQ